MNLTFDPEKHEYRLDGRLLPHVTAIIAPLVDLSMIEPAVLERARQEGVAIHKMAELHFNAQLDLADLYSEPAKAWLVPRYEALLKFIDDTGAQCWASEKRLCHAALGYAGTADFFGLLPKLKNVKGAVNLDIKRSLYGGPATGLQLAGYVRAWNETEAKRVPDLYVPDANRFALELRANGTYKLTQFEDGYDNVAFLACLQQLRWRRKHYPEKAHGRT